MKDELPRLPSEAYIKGREDVSKKLRDEFAGLAMQAIVRCCYDPNHEYPEKEVLLQLGISLTAYQIADAMMEARNDQR